jgi:hypothetical protein
MIDGVVTDDDPKRLSEIERQKKASEILRKKREKRAKRNVDPYLQTR